MTPQINHPQPIATAARDAPAYWQRDALWSVLLSGQATLGQFTLIEQLMPKGNGPPQRIHERMADGFYVLHGAIDFVVDGAPIHVEAGAALWVPPGTPHGFTISSDTARVLNFYSPGGFDDRLPYTAAPRSSARCHPKASRTPTSPPTNRHTATASATYTRKRRSAIRSPNQPRSKPPDRHQPAPNTDGRRHRHVWLAPAGTVARLSQRPSQDPDRRDRRSTSGTERPTVPRRHERGRRPYDTCLLPQTAVRCFERAPALRLLDILCGSADVGIAL
jgi:mannose-6-phosphate isomerase-like protein (cupin superfamily)